VGIKEERRGGRKKGKKAAHPLKFHKVGAAAWLLSSERVNKERLMNSPQRIASSSSSWSSMDE